MRIGILLYLLLNSCLCLAQDWTFYGFFPAISQSGNIGKKLQYNAYISSTIDAFHQTIAEKNYPATALQYYLQPSLSYRLLPNVQIGVGYAYVKHNLFGLHVNENRLWVQAVATHDAPALGRLKVSHRLRYEERYPLNMKSNQWSYATLFRYQIGASLPLYDPKVNKTGFYASVSNEAFLCLTGAINSPISSKNAFYGENWLYGGLGYNTRKFGKIELGYMFQNLIRNPQQDHRYLHLLQATWSTTFDLSEIGVWLYTPTP
ncbi:DUF2490 domain-containing protein [Spirosoma panaciterrae]|uniref:DUF2490 domain-containing protein n=1 Tax=Spirosoma panaciterrae TaxID=496058 RepID=UPI0007C58E80|nr:DUF2490 domain-containing protein [Spirosoma panaciterrae]